jgi:hypothetical protein
VKWLALRDTPGIEAKASMCSPLKYVDQVQQPPISGPSINGEEDHKVPALLHKMSLDEGQRLFEAIGGAMSGHGQDLDHNPHTAVSRPFHIIDQQRQ